MGRAQASIARQMPPPAAAPDLAQLSIFDLDRTLTILPTYTPFLLFAARTRAPWRLLLLPLLLPVALLYALKLVPRRTMKQAMHRLALGGALPERDAARLADRFARHLVARGLYAEGVALIEAERQAGRRVMLATAAPHFYTAALARRLGIADVVATASSWHDGCLVPAIGSANCYGPEKRAMVEAFLDRAGVAPADAHIRFFSDHASDVPMFELADGLTAIASSAKLRSIATSRGWPVLDWRRTGR
jgi:HAD superfamily hydrolase (TIGR01490 family)